MKTPFKIDIDATDAQSTLDRLRASIKESQISLESFNDAVVELAKKTPWYRRLLAIQLATLILQCVGLGIMIANIIRALRP
jgi:hypothetical protein